MNKKRLSFRTLVIVGLVLALLAAAIPPETAQARSTLVRLRVQNRSSSPLYVWLSGPSTYYISVPAGEVQTYTVERGTYEYDMRGCGRTASGSLKMDGHKTLVTPVCGGRVPSASQQPERIDVGGILKLVKVDIINETPGRSLVILTGPSTYAFSLPEDGEKTVTIAKGTYTVQTYACGSYGTRGWTAFKGKDLEVECP